MNISQKHLEERIKEYDLQKPNRGTKISPRVGYYVIQETSAGLIDRLSCPIATALWKPTDNDIFIPQFKCEIELKSLSNPLSVGPKDRLSQDMSGKVIEIYLSKVVRRPINGIIANSLMVYWDIMRITKRELKRKNKIQSGPYKFYFDPQFARSGELPF